MYNISTNSGYTERTLSGEIPAIKEHTQAIKTIKNLGAYNIFVTIVTV